MHGAWWNTVLAFIYKILSIRKPLLGMPIDVGSVHLSRLTRRCASIALNASCAIEAALPLGRAVHCVRLNFLWAINGVNSPPSF